MTRLRIQKNLAPYNTLIDYIKKNRIYLLDGDVVEIGALVGGGTKKLAGFFAPYKKQIITIDLFDMDADNSFTYRGESLSRFYRSLLGRRNLRDEFNRNTRGLKNVTVYAQDSLHVELKSSTKLCFSFIDGNHTPKYVNSDFNLVWQFTVPGGIVAFDDYNGDLPETTLAIESVIKSHEEEIERVDINLKKRIVFIEKKGGGSDGD